MPNLPLYGPAQLYPPSLEIDSHRGLWFDKFFDEWTGDYAKINKAAAGDPGGKKTWIERTAKLPAGGHDRIKELLKRRRRLFTAIGATAREFELTAPFVTGLGYGNPVENGMLWHPTLGVPYLPGSGVKGLVRSWAVTWADDVSSDDVNRILGPRGEQTNAAGDWVFFDALPCAPVDLECEVMTPHDGSWRNEGRRDAVPADWNSPNPIPFLVVKAGTKFQFAFAPRRGRVPAGDDGQRIEDWLKCALDYLGAGAKTSTGYGRFF